jgi:hypothetical protein
MVEAGGGLMPSRQSGADGFSERRRDELARGRGSPRRFSEYARRLRRERPRWPGGHRRPLPVDVMIQNGMTGRGRLTFRFTPAASFWPMRYCAF